MTPKIEIYLEDPNGKLQLLKTIQSYYSIGMPHLNSSYEGYQLINNIVEKKINELIANTIPQEAKKLIDSVIQNFKEYEVANLMHHQFPNYALNIVLSEKTYPGLARTVNLKLNLSLLTKHFLVYFEDLYRFTDYPNDVIPPLKKIIISGSSPELDPDERLKRLLISTVMHAYPDYHYMDHKYAFSYFIKGGTPYRNDYHVQQSDYPIYNYLFGAEVIDKDYSITQ